MALRNQLREQKEKEKEEKEQVIYDEANKEENIVYDQYGYVDEKKTKKNIRKSVKSASGTNKRKHEHFLWVKMWINYLVSMTMKDRGKIPDNIGDRILITNNLYITKLYMTTILQIYELGPNTPITMMEILNNALRDRGNRAILDITCKNEKYEFDPKNSGLQSRIRSWETNVDSEITSRKMRERSKRCLYTVEVAKRGVQLKNTRMFISIRAKDIQTLNTAEKIIYDQLSAMGTAYMPAHSNIKQSLELISIFGNKSPDLKGTVPVMTSNQVLSQIVSNCGSYNDRKGWYCGINILNGSPYYIDVDLVTIARNIYIVAPAGVGKTVLALNIAQSAYENGSAVCCMDIKGNEYTNFIQATNGYIVSLRPTSTEFINTWKMYKSDATPETAETYFKSRVNFSKQQILILSGITDREQLLQMEELLDEFHEAMYITLGAIPSNMNSWKATEDLTPYDVFEKFERYLTPQKMKQYSFNKTVLGTIRMYMSVTGSKSYVFKREFDYASILAADTISFDFGILANVSQADIDLDLFRLKFLYMSRLNSEFTTRKYAEGKRTLKILEESQIVADSVMEMYVQEITLRRAQKQDTLLLGNSVQALNNKTMAQALIENIRGLFIGELTLDARNTVMDQFGIRSLEKYINIPGSSNRFKNSFVFINKMQDKKLYPIIQVQIEKDEHGKPVQYKVNTPVKESNAMMGQ